MAVFIRYLYYIELSPKKQVIFAIFFALGRGKVINA